MWAITQYNRYAAYSIGQMWSGEGDLVFESPGRRRLAGLPFRDGSVFFKINLIGHMKQVPEDLKGAPHWLLNLHTENPAGEAQPSLERRLQRAYIFEADFGVKDSRSPTGWVFGAYVFNPALPSGDNQLLRFELTGIQFGNDPASFPAVDLAGSQPIHQTLLTPFSHHWNIGCHGRMATFIGTPQEGCLSCHQTASFGVDEEGLAPRGFDLYYAGNCTDGQAPSNEANRFYFENAPYGTPYRGHPEVEHPVMIDFSLRSYDAIRAYYRHRQQTERSP